MKTWMYGVKAIQLTPEELQHTVLRFKQHGMNDADAAKTLLLAFFPMIRKIARRIRTVYHLQFSDLCQEGVEGLYKAVHAFDLKHGVRFTSYAPHWIRVHMLRRVAFLDRPIRLPADQLLLMHQIRTIRREVEQTRGFTPTTCEIARALNVRTTQVVRLLVYEQRLLRLEQPIAVDSNDDLTPSDDLTLSDIIPSTVPSPEEVLGNVCTRRMLSKAFMHLSSREKMLLFDRFVRGMTLSEACKDLGLSRQGAGKLQAGAIQKLHAHMVRRGHMP